MLDTKPVPTLSLDAWVNSTELKCDYLLSHFIVVRSILSPKRQAQQSHSTPLLCRWSIGKTLAFGIPPHD